MDRNRKYRILVIDDEENICRIAVECLSRSEYEIETFNDPAQAMEYMASNPVDLVLTDLMMGKYSGIQVIETALENHPDVIVILMTAHPTVEMAISVLKKGAYDFLVKPFKLELLCQTVERGLAHQKVLRENLSLKGQVEFLKVSNAFLGSSMDLDNYLDMILHSCNTELSARASAIIEVRPGSGDIVRQLHVSDNDEAAAQVLDTSLLDQFSGIRKVAPIVHSEPMKENGRCQTQFIISQPIFVRRTLHGVINILAVSRLDEIPPGKMDILSMLAGSAASAIANQNLYNDLQQSYFQAIRALTNAIEARDYYTAGHTDRVTRLAEQVARHLEWTDKQIATLRIGCALHDIGKIGVPDAILNKPDKLTDSERKRMMKHPQLGLRVIRGIDVLKPSIPYIIAHHERYDGQGYPKELVGENIPIEGRLLAVVDTFDAVMSDRPYRDGASLDVAVRELVEHAGTQFDPRMVEAFLEVLRSGVIDFEKLYGRKEDTSCLIQSIATEKAPV